MPDMPDHSEFYGVVVVVGAGSGIGRAVALMAASRGPTTLICSDINPKAAEETAELARAAAGSSERGLRVEALSVDVRDEKSVETLFIAISQVTDRIDIFINTAGIGAAGGIPLAEMTLEDYRSLDEVHNIASFLLLRAALKQLNKQERRPLNTTSDPSKSFSTRGSIVIVTSLASEGSFIGVGNYVSAKHAVKGLVQTAALENARKGIRVNAVAPSYVSGPMMEKLLQTQPPIKEQLLGDLPMGRLTSPSEVADAVLFLASDRASYINGHTLVVDGGASLQLSNTPFTG